MGHDIENQLKELEVLSKISTALWSNPIDTLAAAALKKQKFEDILELACKNTLFAYQQGMRICKFENENFLADLFFHLTPEERLSLIALHIGKWSYARLSRILSRSIQEIEELIWNARIQLGSIGQYPVGPINKSSECPLYHAKKPWTQRFLDQEIHSKKELFSLQNHLLKCVFCHKMLMQCRVFYYRISQHIQSLPYLCVKETTLYEIIENSPKRPPSLKKSLRALFKNFF